MKTTALILKEVAEKLNLRAEKLRHLKRAGSKVKYVGTYKNHAIEFYQTDDVDVNIPFLPLSISSPTFFSLAAKPELKLVFDIKHRGKITKPLSALYANSELKIHSKDMKKANYLFDEKTKKEMIKMFSTKSEFVFEYIIVDKESVRLEILQKAETKTDVLHMINFLIRLVEKIES
jgi:hypothetical protein